MQFVAGIAGFLSGLIQAVAAFLGMQSEFDKEQTSRGRARRDTRTEAVDTFGQRVRDMFYKTSLEGADKELKPQDIMKEARETIEKWRQVGEKFGELVNKVLSFLGLTDMTGKKATPG